MPTNALVTTTPWYLYPVTQDYGQNGETGIDIGTPVHTPLTAILGGTVSDVSYHAYGWQVVVDVPTRMGQFIKETLIHMDQVAVRVGQQVQPGSFLGLSGGEPPLTSPKYSSGPHTELDFFTGTPFASQAINPDAVFRALGNTTVQSAPQTQGHAGGTQGTPLTSGNTLGFDPCAWLPDGFLKQACYANGGAPYNPGGPPLLPTPIQNVADFLALLTQPSTWLRVGGAILGLLLIIVAVSAMLRKE